VLNEKLLEMMGDDVTHEQAFAHANDIIHIPGLVNVDFEDVKTVMSEPGKASRGSRRPDRDSRREG
jgi:cell division protein FtsZ